MQEVIYSSKPRLSRPIFSNEELYTHSWPPRQERDKINIMALPRVSQKSTLLLKTIKADDLNQVAAIA